MLFSDPDRIQLAFDLQDVSVKVAPSYNIAPTHAVLTVVQRAGSKKLELMQWGLIPSWAKDASIGSKMINARAETVAEKPSFKQSLIKRRCIIVADGFYEWRAEGKNKTPMFIHLKSQAPFGMAGLYDTWKSPEGKMVTTCTIITTSANEMMKSIHDRMPVVLSKEAQRVWLDANIQDAGELTGLLKPYPTDEMQAYAVSPMVNSPRNNSRECIEPNKS